MLYSFPLSPTLTITRKSGLLKLILKDLYMKLSMLYESIVYVLFEGTFQALQWIFAPNAYLLVTLPVT